MMNQRKSWVFVVLLGLVSFSYGQSISGASINRDTVHLNLQDAERLMLDKNLDLIANHYNIDIAHAQTIAAKLWDNPGFSYGQTIGNPGHHPFSIQGPYGEVFLQIDQVFKIAGKRHRLVQYKKANEKAVEYAYYDLLRNLKFQFRSDF